MSFKSVPSFSSHCNRDDLFDLLQFFLNSLRCRLPPSMLQTKAFFKNAVELPPPPALLNCVSVRKRTQMLNRRIGDLMFLLFVCFGILQFSILSGLKRFSPFCHLLSTVYKPFKTPRGLAGFACPPDSREHFVTHLAYKMSLRKSLLGSALEVTAGDRGLSFTQKWSEPMPCHLFFNILGFFIIFPLKKEYISTSLKKVFSDLAQSSFCPS